MAHIKFETQHKVISKYSQFGMADITMLLLLFFLLTYNFVPQSSLSVKLPQAEEGSPTDNANQQFLNVVVTDKDEIYVNEILVKEDDLVGALNGAKGTMQKVVIRADKLAHHGPVTAVASAAAALGLGVAIATEPNAEAGSTNSSPSPTGVSQ